MPAIQLKSFHDNIYQRLKNLHEDHHEARQIAFMILEEGLSVRVEEILSDKKIQISNDRLKELESMVERLLQYEPVQHVLGKAYFFGRDFTVDPSVLIPRQETEELVFRVIEDNRSSDRTDILDIGTGSGCIAITLSLELPHSRVWALDTDRNAIITTRINARSLDARVHMFTFDVLSKQSLPGLYDIIVSNPPYVTESEKTGLQKQVLDYEPHTALFVPDDEPLIFYHHIAKKATQSLHPGGKLYFEINERFALETAALLGEHGYKDVQIFDDLNKKPRIIRASKH